MYAVSLDRNLFKQCSSRFKLNGYRKRNAIERYRLLGEAHHRHLQPTTGNRRQRHSKATIAFRRGIFLYLAIRALYYDRRPGQWLIAILVNHSTRHIDLRHGYCCNK